MEPATTEIRVNALKEKKEAYDDELIKKAEKISVLLKQMQKELKELPGFFSADISEHGTLIVMDRRKLKELFNKPYGPLSFQINGVSFIGR